VLDFSLIVQDTHLDSGSRVVEKQRRRFGINGADASQLQSGSVRATVNVRTVNPKILLPFPECELSADEDPVIERLDVSDGNGPVDALSAALRKGLEPSFPHLRGVTLKDFKVRPPVRVKES
jgi:2-isopropylmalate synthase